MKFMQRDGNTAMRSLAWFVLVGAVAAGACGFGAQRAKPKSLLKRVDLERVSLTEKQSRILDRIQKAPSTVQLLVVSFDEKALQNPGPPMMLELGSETTLEFGDYRLEDVKGSPSDDSGKAKRLVWRSGKEGESARIIIRDKSLTGMVYTGEKVFSIKPLGEGLHAVVELDQSKFPRDEKDRQEGAGNAEAQSDPKAQSSSHGTASKNGPTSVVRVLVAYTPSVHDWSTDLASLIDSGVDSVNESCTNSAVRLRMELAGKLLIQYKESPTLGDDLSLFIGNGDGYLDDIHPERDKCAADICVLLVNNQGSDECGAATFLASAATAFAVVHYEYVIDNLSFTHEIGHLHGARHNPEVDSGMSPFAHGHGYLNPGGKWRTIMAYVDPAKRNRDRIRYWSNPDIPYKGDRTGTPHDHDNARVLNTRAPIVASFR